MTLDADHLTEFLFGLLQTPSPTGDTECGLAFIETALNTLGIASRRTRKDALTATLPGTRDTAPRGLTAHADTLGAMVKEIRPNGRLTLTQLGSYAWNTIEGANVTVSTYAHGTLRGTVQPIQASVHVHGAAVGEAKRDAANLEVRIDARTSSPPETLALGIGVGNFVSLDPRVETINGFVKSRHLVYQKPLSRRQSGRRVRACRRQISGRCQTNTRADHHPALQQGQTSDEYHCTLCVKDSGGPYSLDFNRRLRRLATHNALDLKTDIYPPYGAGGEALWRAGADVQAALIGPGVDASHGCERTHRDALVDTARLIGYYLLAD